MFRKPACQVGSTAKPMLPGEFKDWQADAGLSPSGAADALGKSRDTISNYRNAGVPAREVPILRLAMAAIKAGLAPWAGKANSGRDVPR